MQSVLILYTLFTLLVQNCHYNKSAFQTTVQFLVKTVVHILYHAPDLKNFKSAWNKNL